MPNPKTVLITRPEPQASELATYLTAAGHRVWRYPTLIIELIEPPPPLPQNEPAVVIYISAHAVTAAAHAYPELLHHPCSLAMGAATAAAFKRCSGRAVAAVAPPPAESLTLLSLPLLQADRIAGQPITIVRGEGGKELLRDRLIERGAVVAYLELYRRRLPTPAEVPLLTLTEWAAVEVVVTTSREVLYHLLQRCDAVALAALRQKWLVVVGRGAVTLAEEWEFPKERIHCAAAADAASLLAAIEASG